MVSRNLFVSLRYSIQMVSHNIIVFRKYNFIQYVDKSNEV